DINSLPLNARTRVHEYGGGEYILHKGTVYFANFKNQRFYRAAPGAEPKPITPPVKMRYADFIINPRRKRFICVCEDHTHPEREATNMLVSLPLESRTMIASHAAVGTGLAPVRDLASASEGAQISHAVAANLASASEGIQILVAGNDFYAAPRLSP